MKTLLLVWSSQSGNTLALAEAAAKAAGAEDGVAVRMLPALQAGIDDLLGCQALLLATPENFGYMSGALKDFLDRTYYPAQGRTAGLPWALLISAGNDGSGAERAIRRIASGYGWRQALPTLCVRGQPGAADLAAAAELGATLAAALAIGVL